MRHAAVDVILLHVARESGIAARVGGGGSAGALDPAQECLRSLDVEVDAEGVVGRLVVAVGEEDRRALGLLRRLTKPNRSFTVILLYSKTIFVQSSNVPFRYSAAQICRLVIPRHRHFIIPINSQSAFIQSADIISS